MSGSGPKATRGFGNFSTDSKASSLFDAAFSKPAPCRKRTERLIVRPSSSTLPEEPVLPIVANDRSESPKQVFSPPVSLPESTSTDGAMETENVMSNSSDEQEDFPTQSSFGSQSSSASISRALDCTTIAETSTSKKILARPASSTFDFDEEDETEKVQTKRSKVVAERTKLVAAKDNKPLYNHKWTADLDDSDSDAPPSNGSNKSDSNEESNVPPRRNVPCYAANRSRFPNSRVRNVKEAHQILEKGELDDFKQDLDYALSTLKGDEPVNIKCLSAISLARKCVSSEFRQFVRSEGMVNVMFKSLGDSPQSQNFAMCAATVIYLMCRDFTIMAVDSTSLRLFAQLLRIEKLDSGSEQEKYSKMVWDIFTSYLQKMEASGKKVIFEFRQDEITPSSLILEALVFVLTRNAGEALRTELLNLGVLQWLVGKVEKVILRMIHEDLPETVRQHQLLLLERCFRILESCTMFHKKNQAFLISHRGSVLIQMCGKLMGSINSSLKTCTVGSDLAKAYMACLSLMCRVLMNLSHENELCCTKLGQMDGFLPLCLSSCTYLAPKFSLEDKRFDFNVMTLSLLVNMVERCNSNRRKLIDTSVLMYNSENGSEKKATALEALTTLFRAHEAKAKNIDEDLDRDLAFEEVADDQEDDDSNDGRLDRGKLDDMSEGEMLQAVQNAMHKASAHMEDSVMASYIALLIGCLLQQNEEQALKVKSVLVDNSFSAMIDQLTRFLEFMKLTTKKGHGCRSIERIIDLLEKLESS